jgi:prevent-host-death family protein
MKTVGVRDLKEHTSEILKLVREKGETVEITSRGKPIARITPTPEDRSRALREFWKQTDELAQRIAAVWPKGVSAVDTVRDVRDHDYDSPRYERLD